jgi:hypothetical protein
MIHNDLNDFFSENKSEKNSNKIDPLHLESLSSKTSFKIERVSRDKAPVIENN